MEPILGAFRDAVSARLLYISAEESDEQIDVLLAEGKREETLQAAQEAFALAQGFNDIQGARRYRKYLEYIKRGGGARMR